MRIRSLRVENLKAAKLVQLSDLGDMVVIAGPNGCGKSCLFDAIRFLKSSYGGYRPNEWQQWFSEFQINLQRRSGEHGKLFNDRSQPIRVSADIEFSEQERSNLEGASKEIARLLASPPRKEDSTLAYQARQEGEDLNDAVDRVLQQFTEELSGPLVRAEVSITPDFHFDIRPAVTLEAAFSDYAPEGIGIVDYHGPNRDYARESLGGINLSVDPTEGRVRQHALYNYSQKYRNIKAEMAAQLVRESLSARAVGKPIEADSTSLVDTLQELFAVFFPDKTFLGPQATPEGGIDFPVQLPDGSTHDINELSSGEKEVLYGYLRIHNAAPKGSVILIDEPELHLNPQLIRGLPSFYKRRLGEAFGNQIWLITHSDAVLREAIGEVDVSVYHMQLPHLIQKSENQVKPLADLDEAEHAIVDLVGDLATYRPGIKTVIFEGEKDSEFDVRMVRTLFPSFMEAINPVSGGNRARVRELHRILSEAAEQGNLPSKFYSIVDRDYLGSDQEGGRTVLTWDTYHIENYLLNAEFIAIALR